MVLTKWKVDFKLLILSVSLFLLLITDFIILTKRHETIQGSRNTTKKYDHDISTDFVHQIPSFRSCFKDIH